MKQLLNPHMHLVAIDPARESPPRRWRCHYCKLEGPLEEVRKIACGHTYPPCKFCRQTPECAADCPGLAVILFALDKRPKPPEA